MTNQLFKDLKETATCNGEFNQGFTENGALVFRTSGKELVDFNFGIASMRSSSEEEIKGRFLKTWNEEPFLALRMIFFARDCREGLGERRLARICLKQIGELQPNSLIKNLPLIPEYGRWDDVVELLGINDSIDNEIFKIINDQIKKDLEGISEGKPISLIGKWLPSENASSQRTKTLAKLVRKGLNMNSKSYRQLLSKLRAHINIVERQMCANEWSEINYESVPSIANIRYRNCFLRNDETRRREFLGALQNGETKINASVSTPVDIVGAYTKGKWYNFNPDFDITLEEMWKNLTDIDVCNTLVVADGSGSMTVNIANSNLMALDVANALAIYTAERNTNFEGQFMTFGRDPQLVNISNLSSLRDKLRLVRQYDDCANTDIEKVFRVILETAKENDYTQTQLPERILIISDMEFDHGMYFGSDRRSGYASHQTQLFTNIQKGFEAEGFKMPKLIFWNVNSRSGTIPVRENDLGVGLVSGFSQQILKMVMSDKLNPFEILVEQLMSERYEPIHL